MADDLGFVLAALHAGVAAPGDAIAVCRPGLEGAAERLSARLSLPPDARARLRGFASALSGDVTDPGDDDPADVDDVLPDERYGPPAAGASELGRGGLGRVLLVHDRWLDRDVALKELLPDVSGDAATARFRREARITAQLEHPGIVPVYELALRADGRPAYTMQVIRGRTLADVVAAEEDLAGRLRWLDTMVDVAQAVAYAHNRGVVHRDLKPSNVMVGEFGETFVVDWGLARRVDDPSGAEGGAAGTPGWTAPEQARGEASTRAADVWALGALLRYLLTGLAPFVDGSTRVQLDEAAERPLLAVRLDAPDAPADLAAIADKALQHRPGDRFHSAEELAAELDAWRSGRRVGVYSYSAWELFRGFVDRKPGLSAAVASAALLLVLGAAGIAWQAQEARRARDVAVAASERAEESLATLLLERAERAADEHDWAGAAVYAAASLIPAPSDAADLRARAESWFDVASARQEYVHLRDLPVEPPSGGIPAVRSLAASPDGAFVAGSIAAGGVGVWDVLGPLSPRYGAGPPLTRAWGGVLWTEPLGLVDRGATHALTRWDPGLSTPTPVEVVLGQTAVAATDDWLLVGDRRGGVSRFTHDGAAGWSLSLGDRPIEGLATSPSGHHVAAVGLGPSVSVIDLSDGSVRWSAPLPAFASRVAWSPDGQTLALSCSDDAVRILDADTGAPLHTWPTGYRPRSAAFAPSAGRLAHADTPERATIRGPAGDVVEYLHAPHRGAEWFAWGPEGRWLVSSGETTHLRVWRRKEPGLQVLARAPRVLGPFAPSAGAERVVTSSQDRELQAWVQRPGGWLAEGPSWAPNLPGGPPFFVDVDPVGGRVVITDRNGSSEVRGSDGEVVWRGPPARRRRFGARRPAFSPDGGWLALPEPEGGVRLMPQDGGGAPPVRAAEHEIWPVRWSADGSTLYAGTLSGALLALSGPSLVELGVLAQVPDTIGALAVAPAGGWIAAGDVQGAVHLVSPDGGVRRLTDHDGTVNAVCFSPDGRWLGSASSDRSLRIHGVPDGALRRVYLAADDVDGCWFERGGGALWFDDGTELVRLEIGDLSEVRDPHALLAAAERAAGVTLEGSRLVPTTAP